MGPVVSGSKVYCAFRRRNGNTLRKDNYGNNSVWLPKKINVEYYYYYYYFKVYFQYVFRVYKIILGVQ
jgi:hypothetical protein